MSGQADRGRILIFVPNWVGDAVMATPALRALRNRYDSDEFIAVGRPHIAAVFDGTGLIDRYIDWKRKGGGQLASRLRAERADVAVLFPNSIRVAAMAVAARVARRVGTSRGGRGWLLTDRVPRPKDKTPRPVIDLYNRVAEAAGARFGDADRYRTEAAVTSGDRDRFDRFVASRDNGPRDGFVVLNGGGAFGAAKDWPTESFRSLALKITRELERDVVVTCGPAERDTARQIATASDRVFHAADEEPHLGLTKAIVSRAAAMVTTDSGPRHFAKPFGVPVVTLFGPTHVAWSETFDRLARHVQVDVDCGPCQQRVCPLGHHRCMTELTVGRVFDDVAATTGRVAPLAGAA